MYICVCVCVCVCVCARSIEVSCFINSKENIKDKVLGPVPRCVAKLTWKEMQRENKHNNSRIKLNGLVQR